MTETPQFPKRVLLVSDGWVSQMSLCEALENREYVVKLASGGAQAMAVLEETSIDLVITELGAPRVSGMDLLRYMKSRAPLNNIPVIALILPWEAHETPVLQREGVFAIVTAPYSPDDILSHVHEALGDQIRCHSGGFNP